MCGILGWSGPQRPPFSQAQFYAALQQIKHRGPDSEGVWSSPSVMLGHRRLSIIDLSPAGHQPMHCFSDNSVIVYNGEIYNYLELKAELEKEGLRVTGGSDTAVLQTCLAHWGLKALNRLNGMWAFAIWQPQRRQLLLCRDRFGVKPLYYRLGTDGLAFASEPKALLSLYPEHRAISENVLLDFLGNNQLQVPGESFYQGIYLLPPSHYGIYSPDSGQLKIERYWDYPIGSSLSFSPEEAVEQFGYILEDAVRIRLRSDVPVGLTLSGGLDSTAVLAAAHQQTGCALNCYTSVYGERKLSELSWAQLACRPYEAKLEPVLAGRDDWLTVLREVSWHMDSPGYSPAVYPLWCLMRRARQSGVPVLLEGQGADEALAGYPQYAALELLDWLRGNSTQVRTLGGFLTRIRRLKGSVTAKWAMAWIVREMYPRLLHWHRQRNGFASLLREGVAMPCTPEQFSIVGTADAVHSRLQQDHARDILPGLLHYGDAISMAHSIETRNPFLDYRLVEWLFRLPTPYKICDGESKWVLRQYLRNKGQLRIGNRADKKGYPTPVDEWLRGDNRRFIEELLLRPGSQLHQWCDPKRIHELLKRHERGALASGHHLYKLVSTQMWIDLCISNSRA